MANYGELIDSNIDIQRMPIYNFFLEYFGNPRLAKFKETADGTVIYGAKVKSQLSKQKRYLFVLLKKDPRHLSEKFPNEINMRDVQWHCIQTRVLDDDYNLPPFSYTGKGDNVDIKLEKKEDTRYIYSVESFPEASLVLLLAKNQMKPYSDKGTLILALETYNCLVYV